MGNKSRTKKERKNKRSHSSNNASFALPHVIKDNMSLNIKPINQAITEPLKINRELIPVLQKQIIKDIEKTNHINGMALLIHQFASPEIDIAINLSLVDNRPEYWLAVSNMFRNVILLADTQCSVCNRRSEKTIELKLYELYGKRKRILVCDNCDSKLDLYDVEMGLEPDGYDIADELYETIQDGNRTKYKAISNCCMCKKPFNYITDKLGNISDVCEHCWDNIKEDELMIEIDATRRFSVPKNKHNANYEYNSEQEEFRDLFGGGINA